MEQMNIVSATYYIDPITNEPCGIRVVTEDSGMNVPLDPANRHYAEIMRQVEAGELTIQEADN
jgi:hypothetical protein